jgi:hypothetical protein
MIQGHWNAYANVEDFLDLNNQCLARVTAYIECEELLYEVAVFTKLGTKHVGNYTDKAVAKHMAQKAL